MFKSCYYAQLLSGHLLLGLLILTAADLHARPVLENISAALPATDALGRKLPTHQEVGDVKPEKFVGLFYWTWHLNFSKNAPRNVSEILAKEPAAIKDYYHPAWPKNRPDNCYFWGEPLFGYYRNTDKWVLRKHAEMLADAGVDVIFFDCTNGHHTWKESYLALCEAFTEARKDGVKTPQIAFMLAFGGTEGSLRAMKELYTELYDPGLYQDLWFYWKDKPLIMAHPDTLVDVPGDKPATQLHHDIRNFFTFRPGQPLYDKGPQRPDHWGWLEITPQHGFVETAGGFEQATVGVAQNWSKEKGLTAMNAPDAFGRSYTHAKGQINEPDAVNYGHNFQEQWDRALEINPEFIFITGWNEWIAGRYKKWGGQPNAFPDQFDQEHSRDIEPMKGGHGDNYYYQMISNIRRFKGMQPPQKASAPQTINIDGRFADWENALPEFKTHRGSTPSRDSPGWLGVHYTNTTGRNDIALAKAASDDNSVYFYAETSGPLTSKSDPAWMRLLIDVDRNKNTGWEGYDFVVNRTSPGEKAVIEKSVKGWNWERAGDVPFAFEGNKLEIAIPKATLGIEAEVDLEFKWSDNMKEDGNISDFLVNGDVAPAGRFNYVLKTRQSSMPVK